MTPLVVYDCMVYLQAAANGGGPSGACLRRAEAGTVTLCWSEEVEAEVRDVLTRPKLMKKFSGLTPDAVEAFLAAVRRFAVRVDSVPAVVRFARDPKDVKYLDLAVAAGASRIVSRDNDLLDLMTGDDPDAVAFRTDYPAVAVLDPVSFLARLDALPPPGPTS